MSRRALILGTAALLGAALAAFPGPGGAARASKVVTVLPDTLLQMKGSDIYCTVLKAGSASNVACFHDPGGASSSVRKGYAIDASDAFVAVEPSGSTRPSVLKGQPSLRKVPVFSGGAAHKGVVTLALGDVAAVGGTHMAVIVAQASGGGNAIGIVYLDGQNAPVVGTYTIGISNRYVTITKVTGASSTKRIYRHSVY